MVSDEERRRFEEEREIARAQAEGRAPKPVPEVLFVDVQNAGRGQLAAGLFHRAAAGRAHVRSAGTAPDAAVRPAVVSAAAEVGVDLRYEFPKPLVEEFVRAADAIVVLRGSAEPAAPLPEDLHVEWWEVDEDPAGATIEQVRALREQLVLMCDRLAGRLLADTPATAGPPGREAGAHLGGYDAAADYLPPDVHVRLDGRQGAEAPQLQQLDRQAAPDPRRAGSSAEDRDA